MTEPVILPRADVPWSEWSVSARAELIGNSIETVVDDAELRRRIEQEIHAAIQAEREACAKVADETLYGWRAARAIRARGAAAENPENVGGSDPVHEGRA